MLSAIWQQFCLSLNVLINPPFYQPLKQGMSLCWPLVVAFSWCPISMSSHCNSFEGGAPIDFNSKVQTSCRDWLHDRVLGSLKTKDYQFDNFVVTGGTVSCHNDNLQCHQWWQSCQLDDLLFSVDSRPWNNPRWYTPLIWFHIFDFNRW